MKIFNKLILIIQSVDVYGGIILKIKLRKIIQILSLKRKKTTQKTSDISRSYLLGVDLGKKYPKIHS